MAPRTSYEFDFDWHAWPVEQALRHFLDPGARARPLGSTGVICSDKIAALLALARQAGLGPVRSSFMPSPRSPSRGFPLPPAAAQILWVHTATGGTVTESLVTDPADGDEMKRAPVPRNDPLLGAELLRRLALMPLQAVVPYAPPMNALFHTVPLPLASRRPLMLLASAVRWAEEARKLCSRTMPRSR